MDVGGEDVDGGQGAKPASHGDEADPGLDDRRAIAGDGDRRAGCWR